MEVRKSLVAHEAHPGMRVQVVEDTRRPAYQGMFGTAKGTFGIQTTRRWMCSWKTGGLSCSGSTSSRR